MPSPRATGATRVSRTWTRRSATRISNALPMRASPDAASPSCRASARCPTCPPFDRIVERIAALDWHVDLYPPGNPAADFRPRLTALPVPYVLDHMGVVDASLGLDQPAFVELLDLVRERRKVLGEGHMPRAHLADGTALPRCRSFRQGPDRRGAAIASSGERDWPHPNVPMMPDDGDLVDLIPLYAPDPAVQHKLLVENPARLFRFAD